MASSWAQGLPGWATFLQLEQTLVVQAWHTMLLLKLSDDPRNAEHVCIGQ
jgi:hypothetical protein